MRLFIAIELDNETKNKIISSAQNLKEYIISANYSRIENLHFTLAFLGETKESELNTVKRIINNIKLNEFDINIEGYNAFKTSGGDLIFRNIKAPKSLFDSKSLLVNELLLQGINVDTKPFKAHLTIAREAKLIKLIDYRSIAFDIINYHVSAISLMKSERINNVLKYTCIYKKELK